MNCEVSWVDKMEKQKTRTYKIKGHAKAFFEILIAEVQSANPNDEIKEILKGWIDANNLHPEKVKIKNGLAALQDELRRNSSS